VLGLWKVEHERLHVSLSFFVIARCKFYS